MMGNFLFFLSFSFLFVISNVVKKFIVVNIPSNILFFIQLGVIQISQRDFSVLRAKMYFTKQKVSVDDLSSIRFFTAITYKL